MTLCSNFRVKKHLHVFARSDMHKWYKRFNCLVYIITCIFVFMVVLYGYHTKENGDSVTRTSTYQPLAGVASDIISTPTTSCVTGRPCQYQDQVDFRVIVITFNRPDSLSKLLRSLDTLVLDGDRAALEIWIDRHRKNGVDQRTLEVASAFKWNGGPTRVHVQVSLSCSWGWSTCTALVCNRLLAIFNISYV